MENITNFDSITETTTCKPCEDNFTQYKQGYTNDTECARFYVMKITITYLAMFRAKVRAILVRMGDHSIRNNIGRQNVSHSLVVPWILPASKTLNMTNNTGSYEEYVDPLTSDLIPFTQFLGILDDAIECKQKLHNSWEQLQSYSKHYSAAIAL